MFDVGRVCFKIAGRDSNRYCVIVKVVDKNFVLIDGQTRRKKVNVRHIEPTSQMMDIKENADHGAVVEAFSKMGIQIANKKAKSAAIRPKRVKAVKEKKVKKAVKESKKEKPKKEKSEGTEDKKPKKVVKPKAEKKE